MKEEPEIICKVKQYRETAGMTQTRLAESIGVKRQAIYDIESGRYLPNTAVALRLAKLFSCRVEDLFVETGSEEYKPVIMAEGSRRDDSRVSVVNVRGKLIGYPLEGSFSLSEELRPADGILGRGGVKLLNSGPVMENTVLLLGCDPAFSLLAAHVNRKDPKARVVCRFASSGKALTALSAGQAHIAGTHLQTDSGEDANVILAREKLGDAGGMVMGFSLMEEGYMVAPDNPLGIGSAADIASTRARFVNREPGAALRKLFDDELANSGVPSSAVTGYDLVVRTHSRGAQMVACHAADVALGLRPIADAFGLDFIPTTEVRCDLVLPDDLLDHPTIRIMLDILQTRDLRNEIGLIPGYCPSKTGNLIVRL